MTNDKTSIERTPDGKARITVGFTEQQVKPAEEKALQDLGKNVKLKGFREGKAPLDVIKENVDPDDVMDRLIRHLLHDAMPAIMEQHSVRPLLPPSVEVLSNEPLTLAVMFIEKPTVKWKKKLPKIKKEKPKVDDKDVQRVIDSMLKQHETTKVVDRAAKKDDRLKADFEGKDKEGTPIEGAAAKGYEITIGSDMLIPGFEDELIGLKAGDDKTFTVKFPAKYHVENLQKKEVTFSVNIHEVAEVTKPELTDEFIKKNLNADTESQLRKDINKELVAQEEESEAVRRERLVLEAIAENAKMELPEELIAHETRSLFEEQRAQLAKHNMSLDDWVKASGKTPEELSEHLKEQALKRIHTRFGLQELMEEHKIEIPREEVLALKNTLPPERTKDIEDPESDAYLQLEWQKKMDKLMQLLLEQLS